jgi:hypothetical protein
MKDIARWQLTSLLWLMVVVMAYPLLHDRFPTAPQGILLGMMFHTLGIFVLMVGLAFKKGRPNGWLYPLILNWVSIPVTVYFFPWFAEVRIISYILFVAMLLVTLNSIAGLFLSGSIAFRRRLLVSVAIQTATFYLVGLPVPPFDRVSLVLLAIAASLIVYRGYNPDPQPTMVAVK